MKKERGNTPSSGNNSSKSQTGSKTRTGQKRQGMSQDNTGATQKTRASRGHGGLNDEGTNVSYEEER
jgi:hypothetical protein